ncbi:HEPN domain-containing protein [Streptomyces sp. B3I8]|uniref:HEPN domain-containing protein n=1 Tax=Streptomyces sp. B3I8 TaxID=3042303 RepID=UPI00277D3287|nr:HEPN domain-containing protein [Streptomyces sp. B3I8]MDQ0789202.1 hypothetical protein [Streptomyces sp. B3I8]
MPSPLLAGAVVLLCARFEEFLKDVVSYALERHGYSQPPLTLWDLPEKLQIQLISKNMAAALQGNRHGSIRPPVERITEGVAAAKRFVNGVISAEHAIDTGGNPGPETVAGLLKLVGVDAPWKKVADHLQTNYVAPTGHGLGLISMGHPEERLRQIINLRNIVAHSGASIPASPDEIRFNVDFLSQLSNSIYAVLKEQVGDFARSLGRVPANWNP